VGGGGAGGVGGAGRGGTGGSSAGTGGTGGCIPTASTRQCANNGECCDFTANQASCVNFPDRGAFCTARCTTNANCSSNCCVTLDSGNRACAFPEFCSGTGGTSGAGGSGGIGSPCTGSMTPCGSGPSAGTCNGRWCTKQCTTSADCFGNTYCIRNNAGTNTCFVGCTTTTQCAAFTGTTCQSTTDVSGNAISICSLP
jgi:hypothetical protein